MRILALKLGDNPIWYRTLCIKRCYLPNFWSDKGFKGTVVNRVYPCFRWRATWNYDCDVNYDVKVNTSKMRGCLPTCVWEEIIIIGVLLETLFHWRPSLTSRWRPPDFNWKPQILIWRPQILVGDPHIFIGDPQIPVGDPHIFIEDLLFSLETARFVL